MTTIGSTSYYATSRYASANESSIVDETTGSRTHDSKATASQNSAEGGIDSRPSTAAQNLQIKLSSARLLDLSAFKVTRTWEAPDEIYQSIVQGLQGSLEADYRSEPVAPELSSYAGIKPYAEVVAGGIIVATIDNQGVVGTDDDILGEKFKSLLSDRVDGTNGPDLAQALAEQIAGLVGGKVVKSDTALTQGEFDALPLPPAAVATMDYRGMRADQRYEWLQNLMRNRAEYLDV